MKSIRRSKGGKKNVSKYCQMTMSLKNRIARRGLEFEWGRSTAGFWVQSSAFKATSEGFKEISATINF